MHFLTLAEYNNFIIILKKYLKNKNECGIIKKVFQKSVLKIRKCIKGFKK
jgi:hypothetical protein